jgi:hemerythrin superfamily protein
MTNQPTDESDLLELLEADHVRLVRLAGDGAATIVAELTAHLVAEDQLLYPEARRSLPDDEMIDGCLDRDHELERVLARFDRGEATVDELSDLVIAHAASLEGDLFPALRDVVDQEVLVELAEALPAVLAAAPTHAHPGVADEGPLEVIGDTLAAGLDRIRDRFS